MEVYNPRNRGTGTRSSQDCVPYQYAGLKIFQDGSHFSAPPVPHLGHLGHIHVLCPILGHQEKGSSSVRDFQRLSEVIGDHERSTKLKN